MTRNADTLNPDRYRHIGEHEIRELHPLLVARINAVALATEKSHVAANSMSAMASPRVRVGSVAAANLVIPAKPLTHINKLTETDSIVAEVPELQKYAADENELMEATARIAQAAAAQARGAVNQAHEERLPEQQPAASESPFNQLQEAGFADPLSPNASYIEGVADSTAAEQRARAQVDAAFPTGSQDQYTRAA